jgi:hypothetical protein
MTQNTSSAVMQQRSSPPDALEDFPTPPWATRALLEFLIEIEGELNILGMVVREPACNRGFMARPLSELFYKVEASDVHDYLFPGLMAGAQWTITNPPFKLALQFVLKSFQTPWWRGTAMLVRTSFLEGTGRYFKLFDPHPPAYVLQFCERVPMIQGELNEHASTASTYCWIIWTRDCDRDRPATAFCWIPKCRKRLEKPGDYDVIPNRV